MTLSSQGSDHQVLAQRLCPHCGNQQVVHLVSLTAGEIAEANWSYRQDYAALLNTHADERFDIVRCNRCSFVFAKALPSKKFLNTLYDQVIDLNTEAARANYSGDNARRLSYLSSIARLHNDKTKGLRVLDYGAGFGQTSRLMAAQDMDVTAYETSALRRVELSKMSISVAESKASIIENAPYSVVVCDNVLEHVPSPQDELEFFKSVVKPNGFLFISVPSCEPGELTQLINARSKSLNPWEHLNYFNIEQLDSMLKNTGWIPVSANEVGLNIDIGLRPELRFGARLKNACASALRLAKFVSSANAVRSVNCVFYKLGAY